MRVLVAEASQASHPGAVVASSGNAAVAAASACARAGLPLLVLVPAAVSPAALAMIELRGAAVVRAGEGPAAVHGLASRLGAEFGLANLASTFGAAGCEWACRGIGHELAEQLPGADVDELAASISVGPVLTGAANGLTEAGRPLPRLVGAQAAAVAPIAKAWTEGADEVAPWTGTGTTAALAIADRLTGYAHEATFALRRIRCSGGAVDAVTDAEMADMRIRLARHDGIDVELASAAAAVALSRRPRTGGRVVCILTGAGHKETLSPGYRPPPASSIEQFAEDTGAGAALVREVQAWMTASRS